MKKYLLITLALMASIICLSFDTVAASVDDLTFTLNSDGTEYSLTACSSTATGEVVIPDTYNDLPVTSIGDKAFYENGSITAVTVPSSVKSIGEYAFYNCYSLTSVTLNEGLETIGSYAFQYVPITGIYLPQTLTYIDEFAFFSTNLVEVKIPDKIVKIDNYTFAYCYSLTTVYLGKNVASVDEYVFYCSGAITTVSVPDNYTLSTIDPRLYQNLTTLIVPASVKYINPLFYSKSSLKKIIIEDGNEYCVLENGVLFTADKSTLLRYPSLKKDTFFYTIPSFVTTIGDYAFSYCDSLTTITLNEGLKTIGNHAFEDINYITSLSIPSSVTIIGDYAFSYSDSLKSITLNEGLEKIGSYAFAYTPITEIYLPQTLTCIGDYAFFDCISLTSVTLNEGLETIGEYVFTNTPITEIYLPQTLTSIGSRAFYDCEKLTSVDVPSSVTSIEAEAFYSCSSLISVTLNEGLEIIGNSAFYATAITEIYLPQTLTSIGNYAFFDCISLTSVTLNEGLKKIGEWAFAYTPITEIYLPQALTEIGGYAFYSTNLTEVTIPDKFTYLQGHAFSDCSSLQTVYLGKNVTSISDYAFYGSNNITTVSLPDNFTSTPPSALYNNINKLIIPASVVSVNSFFYSSDTLKEIVVEEGNEYYSSDDGVLFNADKSTIVRYLRSKKDTSYTVPSSVTTIGSSAFYDNEYITSVVVPSSVTTIGSYSFQSCSSLTSVTLNEGLETIGEYAFANTPITEIYLPQTLTSIGYRAFNNTDLVEVTIPDKITTIYYDTFAYCPFLETVYLGKKLTSIDSYAFYNCSKITTVSVPDNFTSTPPSELYSNIKKLIIPASVVSVDSYFYSSNTLKEIVVEEGNKYYSSEDGVLFNADMSTLVKYPRARDDSSYTVPSSVTTIGTYAFYQPSNLKSLTVLDNVTAINPVGLLSYNDLTVSCYENSLVHTYAFSNSIPYEIILKCEHSYTQNATAEYLISNADCTSSAIYYMSCSECGEKSDETFEYGEALGHDYKWTIDNFTQQRICSVCGDELLGEHSGGNPTCDFAMCTVCQSYYGGYTEHTFDEYRKCSGCTTETHESGLLVKPSEDGTYYIITGFGKYDGNDVVIPTSHNGLEVNEITGNAFSGCTDIVSITIADSIKTIGVGAFSDSENVVIKCYENSEAHKFALENDISYYLMSPLDVMGTSLILDSQIGIKVYFYIDTAKVSLSTVRFSTTRINSDYKEYTSEEMAALYRTSGYSTTTHGEEWMSPIAYDEESGLYYVILSISPKDADNTRFTNSIKYTLRDGTSVNYGSIDTDFSVLQYIDSAKQLAAEGVEAFEKAIGLIEAMESYITYADNYFSEGAAESYRTTASLDSIVEPTVIDPGVKRLQFVSSSLILDEKITIRHYFKVGSLTIHDRLYTSDIEYNVKGDLICYDITDISPEDIGTPQKFTIYDKRGNEVFVIEYSVANYIASAMSSGNDRLASLMNAMYDYYLATMYYLK